MLNSSFCSVAGGASLLCLAPCVCAPKLSSSLLLFQFSLFPYPRSCLVFCSRDVGSAVLPRVAPSIFRLRGESNAYSQAPLLPPAFRGGAVLYCTVLYCTVLYCTVLYCTVLHCTVLYASFDAMAVGSNSLTCGTNWQCTADAIGYVVMIRARLDSLTSPHSLPRFRSTPAGRQLG